MDNVTSKDWKTTYRCVNGSWAPFAAQPMTTQELCKIPNDLDPTANEGVHVMIIKTVDIGNPRKILRFYIATANETRNETNPVDFAGPYYYTPGSVDVKFENCLLPGSDGDGDGLDSENDPDCQKFMKYGFVQFEMGPQCQDDIDNDGNGKTDCEDESCRYDPFGICGGGSNGVMVCSASDKKSPLLKWHDAKVSPGHASIKFDSDEPANGTIEFYYDDAACTSLNITLKDFALNNPTTNDDYKLWHNVVIDRYSLGYNLTPDTSYYYKLRMTDICGNKLVSACLNFTTKSTYDTFVFKPVPPSGVYIDIPELGISGENFEYGQNLNSSETINTTFKLRDTTNGFTISFNGVSILSANSFNITTTYNDTGGEKYVGMESDSWNKIQTDFSPDDFDLTIPDTGSEIWKCDEDNLSNCVNVTSVVDCTYGAINTTCEVPLSAGLGFSVYKVVTVPSSSTPSSGGGSGGGAGGGVITTTTGTEGITATATKVLTSISEGSTLSTSVVKTGVAITALEMHFTAPFSTLSITVNSYGDSRPSSVPAFEGKAYQYLEIKHPDFTGKVEDTGVKFKVTTAWLSANELTAAQIRIFRLEDGIWVQYTPTVTATTGSEVTFSVSVPGFSYFVIGSEPTDTTGTATSDTATTDTAVVDTTESTDDGVPPPPETPIVTPPVVNEKTGGGNAWLWVFGIIVVVVIAIVLLRKKRGAVDVDRVVVEPPESENTEPPVPQPPEHAHIKHNKK